MISLSPSLSLSLHSVSFKLTSYVALITGSRFWRTTKIIRALSEANYNRLQRQLRDRPGPSHMAGSSLKPFTVPSDSDSEELKPLARKRKRPFPTYDSSTESDSSLPHTKVCSTDMPTPTMKILSEIKCLLGDYHTEVVHLRLEREIDTKKSSVYMMLSCLICKEIAAEESVPVVPPCCRAAVVCQECMDRWLDTQPTCPHCREPLLIDNCVKFPILRPLFDFLAQCGNDQ